MAVGLTPVIYMAHYFMDNYLGHDVATVMKQKAASWE